MYYYTTQELLVSLVLAAFLGLIPAFIAKKKGRKHIFFWWLYGWMIFIVALIHTIVMPNWNKQNKNQSSDHSSDGLFGNPSQNRTYQDPFQTSTHQSQQTHQADHSRDSSTDHIVCVHCGQRLAPNVTKCPNCGMKP